MAKRIYILCPVTIATPEDKAMLQAHVDMMEDEGHVVHYPARDTDQNSDGFNRCLENGAAMDEADEIHLFYRQGSEGSKFDLGFCFAVSFFYRHNEQKFKVMDLGDASGEWRNLIQKWENLR